MPPVRQKRRQHVRSLPVAAAQGNGKLQAWTFAEFMAQDFTGEEDLWYGEAVADYIAKEKERCQSAAQEEKAAAPS